MVISYRLFIELPQNMLYRDISSSRYEMTCIVIEDFGHITQPYLNEDCTWYKSLRNPHGEMPTDAKHAAREEVRGSADDSHTGQRAVKEHRSVVWHVHLHQHRGHHKHQEDHGKRRQDPHVWRHPTKAAHTHRDVLGLGGRLSKISWST